jgi:hypothetical protein
MRVVKLARIHGVVWTRAAGAKAGFKVKTALQAEVNPDYDTPLLYCKECIHVTASSSIMRTIRDSNNERERNGDGNWERGTEGMEKV